MLAMSSSTYLALDLEQLLNCRRFSITVRTYFWWHTKVNILVKVQFYWSETACLINEKCNLEYYQELTPEPRIFDAGDYL